MAHNAYRIAAGIIYILGYSILLYKKEIIMKKTLAAVAVLGAFAGSALAADVTLYGRVNLGVNYTHTDKGSVETDDFTLNSGDATASRWGIKGSEQISEGLTVGFTLESGFNADDGDDQEDKLFRRESRLYVTTDFGTLHMGRFGALDAATGSLDYTGWLSASGTGYGDIINDHGRVLKTYGRLDNSIAYTSPTFAGMTIAAMASLGNDNSELTKVTVTNGKVGFAYDTDGEGSSNVDRYYGLGVKGQWGALGAGLVVSMVDAGHDAFTASYDGTDWTRKTGDDNYNVTAGVNYDFGVAKVFLAGNYFKGGEVSKYTNGTFDSKTETSSWGVSTSVSAPLASGTLEAAVAYGISTDETAGKADVETKVLNVGAFYKYPLSKRTYVYAGAGYDQSEKDGDDKKKTIEAISGIVHQF